MKKTQRKILEKILDNKGPEIVIYEPITAEPYKLKKKYTASKPT